MRESISDELVAQLFSESVRSHRLLESSQSQVELMMAQLLDLKIDQARVAIERLSALRRNR